MARFPSRPASAQSIQVRPHENKPSRTFEFANTLDKQKEIQPFHIPFSSNLQNLAPPSIAHLRGSRTWTSTSGDLGLLADADQVEDRAIFVYEYNRLAKKHGVRVLIVEDFDTTKPTNEQKGKRRWYHRLFKPTPESTTAPKPTAQPRAAHRRSASEIAYLIHTKRDPLKILDLQSMVRLSGKSILYLAADYSPCALILPTCLRATAQYLEQHTAVRGLFRVPGSVKVVGAIFDYYCHTDKGNQDIAGTVHRATLPAHIPFSTHDIASVFKRLLSLLPGGILGSLSLFDAFVAIHSQLAGVPEFPRTSQTKVRARLIALAIGTVKSQYQRELICAVFGLLSHIGRVAEVAPREDIDGKPLPTTDLMGYAALGIVFGPLLVNNLMEQYVMKLAVPEAGMIVLPSASPRIHRERQSSQGTRQGAPVVNKILIANDIAEMLISNWRDVVSQMKILGTHHRKDVSATPQSPKHVKSSASDNFVMRLPQDFEQLPNTKKQTTNERSGSPEPITAEGDIRRSRSRTAKPQQPLLARPSLLALSPTPEEDSANTSHATSVNVHRTGPETRSRGDVMLADYTKNEVEPPRTAHELLELDNVRHTPRHGKSSPSKTSTPSKQNREERRKRLLMVSSPSTSTRTSRHEAKHNMEGQSPGQRVARNEPPDDVNETRQRYSQRLSTTANAGKGPNQTTTRHQTENGVQNQLTPTKNAQTQRRPMTDPIPKNKRASLKTITQPPDRVHASEHKTSVRTLAALFENQQTPSKRDVERNVSHRHKDQRLQPNLRLNTTISTPPNRKTEFNRKDEAVTPSKWWKGGHSQPAKTRVLRHSASEGTSPGLRGHNRGNREDVVDDSFLGSLIVPDMVQKATHEDITELLRIIDDLNERVFTLTSERDKLGQKKQTTLTTHEACRAQIEFAKKEIMTWRRRAEQAERKNKVFEKFTARLRGIRDNAVAEDGCGGDGGASPGPRVRFAKAGASTSSFGPEVQEGTNKLQGTDNAQSVGSQGNDRLEDMYGEVAALWMAAKDVFGEQEDEGNGKEAVG